MIKRVQQHSKSPFARKSELSDDKTMNESCQRCWPTAYFIWASLTLLFCSQAFAEQYRFDRPTYLGNAELLPNWAETIVRHRAQKLQIDTCLVDEKLCDSRGLKSLRHILLRAADLEPERQFSLINRYVNKRHFRRDRAHRQLSAISEREEVFRSKWITLLEFLRRGGDCEDYATAKYFLLRELGFPVHDLRVLVSYDRKVRGYHAVLAVRQPDDSVWFLESNGSIIRGKHRGYHYIFAVNEESVWDHDAEKG